MPRRCALDAARAALTPSTSSPSLTFVSQTLRRIRHASSSSSSSPSTSASSATRSESVRSDVRSGKRPPFADIAAHVLTQTRAKQTFGWDVRIACVIYKLQGVDIDAFAMFYQTLLRFIGDIHLILRIGLRRALHLLELLLLHFGKFVFIKTVETT